MNQLYCFAVIKKWELFSYVIMEIYQKALPEIQKHIRSFLGPHPTVRMIRWWKRNKNYPILSTKQRFTIYMKWTKNHYHFPIEAWNPIVKGTPSMQAYDKWVLLKNLMSRIHTGTEYCVEDWINMV